jgi:hypothetical protein
MMHLLACTRQYQLPTIPPPPLPLLLRLLVCISCTNLVDARVVDARVVWMHGELYHVSVTLCVYVCMCAGPHASTSALSQTSSLQPPRGRGQLAHYTALCLRHYLRVHLALATNSAFADSHNNHSHSNRYGGQQADQHDMIGLGSPISGHRERRGDGKTEGGRPVSLPLTYV